MDSPLYTDPKDPGQFSDNVGVQLYLTGGETQAGYNSVVTNDLNQNGFVRYWDDAAKEPYLFNGNELVTYEDPQSIYYKTQYINQNRLGGAMIWSFNQDYDGQLLATIFNNLNTSNH